MSQTTLCELCVRLEPLDSPPPPGQGDLMWNGVDAPQPHLAFYVRSRKDGMVVWHGGILDFDSLRGKLDKQSNRTTYSVHVGGVTKNLVEFRREHNANTVDAPKRAVFVYLPGTGWVSLDHAVKKFPNGCDPAAREASAANVSDSGLRDGLNSNGKRPATQLQPSISQERLAALRPICMALALGFPGARTTHDAADMMQEYMASDPTPSTVNLNLHQQLCAKCNAETYVFGWKVGCCQVKLLAPLVGFERALT